MRMPPEVRNRPPKKQVVSKEEIEATYDRFAIQDDLPKVLAEFKLLCSHLNLKPTPFPEFFEQLRTSLRGYRKARVFLDEIYATAKYRGYAQPDPAPESLNPTEDMEDETEYIMDERPRACGQRKILIVGSGPSGLRMAIEAQFLGAKVVVIEMRKNFTRYNIAHMWQQAVEDLLGLRVRHFSKDFCTGAHNTISIRQLQFVLLKLALILGVEFHCDVSYESLVEPTSELGWRAKVSPANHAVNNFEFDVLVNSSGKRGLVYDIDIPMETQNKRYKKIAKSMIAVAANFVYNGKNSERYKEIAGVSDLYKKESAVISKIQERGVAIETIVYYRRETHYFIMTIKNPVLKEKNLIKEEYDSFQKNLAADNINRQNLEKLVLEVANLATNSSMDSSNPKERSPEIHKFHRNEHGEKDVAIFGYEALASASNSSRILERKGKILLMFLVGDSLIEPFWPEGTGIIKGFMGALDACYVMKLWSLNERWITPLQLLATKEFLYSHLRYMDKTGLIKEPKAFRPKLDPWCRYNRDSSFKKSHAHLRKLFDTDIDLKSKEMEEVELFEVPPGGYRNPECTYGSEMMLEWYNELLSMLNVTVVDLTESWSNGVALLGVICLWEPDLIDWFLMSDDDIKNNQRAINILALKFGIPPHMTGKQLAEITEKDEAIMSSYLNKVLSFITTNYSNLIIETKKRTSLGSTDALPPPSKCLPGATKVKSLLGKSILQKIKSRMRLRKHAREGEKGDDGEHSDNEKVLNEKESRDDAAEEIRAIPPEAKTETTSKTRTERVTVKFEAPIKPDQEKADKSLKKKPQTDEILKTPSKTEIMEPEKASDSGTTPLSLKRNKLQRSGSFPNIMVRMTTGECCIICNKLIHAAVRCLTKGDHPVHRKCFRCAECDRRVEKIYYTYDEQAKKFYCKEHSNQDDDEFTKLLPISESENESDEQEPKAKSTRHRTKSKVSVDDRATSSTDLEKLLPTPELQARSLKWLQETPKALDIVLSMSEVQKVIMTVAMEHPDLKALGPPTSESNEKLDSPTTQQPAHEETGMETRVPEEKPTHREEDTAASRATVCPEQDDLAGGHRVNEEEDIMSSIPAKGTVARAAKKLSKLLEKDSGVTRLQRVKSCPHLIKNRELETCHYCQKRVFMADRITICKLHFHRHCFKCQQCGLRLTNKTFHFDVLNKLFLCVVHKDVLLAQKSSRKELKSSTKNLVAEESKPAVHKRSPALNKWKLAKMARKLTTVFRVKEEDEMPETTEDESQA